MCFISVIGGVFFLKLDTVRKESYKYKFLRNELINSIEEITAHWYLSTQLYIRGHGLPGGLKDPNYALIMKYLPAHT